MAIQKVTDAFITVQTAGDTYEGNAANQTYSLNPNLIGAGDQITLIDQGGTNKIELVGGLQITNSVVVANEAVLTLSNGAIINIRNADTFTYVDGGNTAAGISGQDLTFSQFVTAIGSSIPATGAPATTTTTPVTVTSGGGTSTGTGTGDSSEFSIVAASPSVAEGASGTVTNIDTTITRTGDTTAVATVDVAIAGVTATAGTDFTALATQTVSFAAGETSKTVSVAVTGDGDIETDETLTATLSNASTGSTISSSANATTLTITNDDVPTTFAVTSDNVTAEGNTVTFTVTPSGTVTDATALTYSIVGNTLNGAVNATNSADFDISSGTVNFAAGATGAQTVSVQLVGGDALETTEGYTFSLLDSSLSVVSSINGQIIDGANTGGSGQTLTLTNQLDNLIGSSADDLFIGDATSTSAGDTLDGGAGTDTLSLFLGSGNVAEPNHSNIEIISLTGGTVAVTADLSDDAAVTNVNITDPFTVSTYTTNNGQDISLATMVAGEVVDFAGNSVTAMNLTVDGLSTSGNDVTIDLNSTAQTSLNVTTANNASQITLTNTGGILNTLNIAGDQSLEIGSALTLSTINASTSTGAVDVDALAATSLTFTGGSGNDRIAMAGTLTASDTLDGGAGTDTLAVNTAYTAATTLNVSNFEQIELDAAITQNLSVLNSNNTLSGLILAEAAAGNTTVTGINAATGNNITLTADNTNTALTVSSHVAGGTTDAATLIFNDSATNGSGVDIATTLTMVNVDTLSIQSVSDGTAAAGEQNSIVGLTATDLDAMTITGDQSISIATAATTVALTEVDASGLTVESGGTFNFDSSLSAITSILVKGTSGNDSINVSNAATTSTIYTGGGTDALTIATGTGGTLQFTSSTLGSGDLAANTAITIATATAANDISLNMTSGVESALNFGGVNLGSTAANVTINSGISATNNIGYTETGANSLLQIDLNNDGAYTASDDIQIQITGGAGTLTGVTYNASTDIFTFV